MTMTIGRATPEDLGDVVQLLADAATWLHSRGFDQWQAEGFAVPERIARYVGRAEVWIVRGDDGQGVATVRVAGEADAPQLWTPAERAELALYVSKLAIDQAHAGEGLGALVLRWISDHAAQLGYRWVRLDAWRSNPGLHDYYLSRGWEHVRTGDLPGRNSTALFQRPAAPDPEARAAFAVPPSAWLAPGTRVKVDHRERKGTGTITALYSPAGLGEVSDPGDYGILPSAGYWVELDGGDAVLCLPEEITPQSLAAKA
jgi:GNAT superfamily N-acetyltransferase